MKLQPHDEIRVIAPSMSWRETRSGSYRRAVAFMEEAGFRVSFGKHIADVERLGTGSVAARISDLQQAYQDPDVKAVFALHGGWSANALLDHIDWNVIRANPKPLIGFSDITVLHNAIYAKAEHVGYLGPNFASLGHVAAGEYSRTNLLDVLTGTDPLLLKRSDRWERTRGKPLARTRRWEVLQAGTAEGTLLGGNLGTLYLLQGTEYMPAFDKPTIVAIEDDDEAGRFSAQEFDRRLTSLLQLPGARQNITGIVVGRFQPDSKVTLPDIRYIMRRMDLPNIPIIIDMDFGHTWPMLTLPIGGTMAITTENNQAQVKLLNY